MNRRALRLFHIAMGAVYLGILVAQMKNLVALRNLLLFSSLLFCVVGAAGCWVVIATLYARKNTRSGKAILSRNADAEIGSCPATTSVEPSRDPALRPWFVPNQCDDTQHAGSLVLAVEFDR